MVKNVMEIFVTSDTHFCHNRDFLYTPRGFDNIYEMNEAIIERWNNVVKPGDTVYHLGDIALMDNAGGIRCVNRLNGNIIWLLGNHDSPSRVREFINNCNNLQVCKDRYATTMKFTVLNMNLQFYLSHYRTITTNFDQKDFTRRVINLHGHTHQKENWEDLTNPFCYHVGLDSHNCTPVHIEEVVTDIKQHWYELGSIPNIAK